MDLCLNCRSPINGSHILLMPTIVLSKVWHMRQYSCYIVCCHGNGECDWRVGSIYWTPSDTNLVNMIQQTQTMEYSWQQDNQPSITCKHIVYVGGIWCHLSDWAPTWSRWQLRGSLWLCSIVCILSGGFTALSQDKVLTCMFLLLDHLCIVNQLDLKAFLHVGFWMQFISF